jgi:GntR family transcriptional regulator
MLLYECSHTVRQPVTRGQLLDNLRIERSGVPIYVQIRDQMLTAIGAGILKPGERLPTMRQVAVALKIDLNTVRHAYDVLAQTGVIAVQPARGTFVAESPPSVALPALAERLEEFAQRTIASARANGLEPADVARRLIAIEEEKGDRK